MDQREIDLLDHVETPIFVLEMDRMDRLVYVVFNSAACRISGFVVADIIGKTAAEFYPEGWGKIAYEHHCQAYAGGCADDYEISLPFECGMRRIRTSLRPIFDDGGKVLRLIGTSKDITAERRIQEAQAMATTINSEVEQFISLAAHDLRSPIKNVELLASMLREDFEDMGDGKLELIDMLERVASKATSLIGDLMDHAQATNATEAIETVNLKPLCDDILMMFDPAGRHSAKIDDKRIFGDRIAIQIVLRNLIDNAFKHNDNRSLALKISAAKAGQDSFEICVQDDGAGFADPALAFLDGGHLRSESGFGLFGVRRLITERGGTIAASRPASGDGAVVRFTLPGHVT